MPLRSRWCAALSTSRSRPPNASHVRSTRSMQYCSSSRVAGTARRGGRHFTHRAVSSASACSDGRYEIATSAPSRANAMATARPMPESPPVMSAPAGETPMAAVAVLAAVGLRAALAGVRPGRRLLLPRERLGSVLGRRVGQVVGHGSSSRRFVRIVQRRQRYAASPPCGDGLTRCRGPLPSPAVRRVRPASTMPREWGSTPRRRAPRTPTVEDTRPTGCSEVPPVRGGRSPSTRRVPKERS